MKMRFPTVARAAAAALLVVLAGCVSSELVFIEDSNPRLPVVKFGENVFQATIWYDYSNISDFDESKVHAVR